MSENEHRAEVPTSTGNIVTLVMSWASGQPFNNVMLMAIFSALCWITYFAVTVAIPAHMKQIQEGYEKLEKSNTEERRETIEVYDKWFERMERYHDDHEDRKTGSTKGAYVRPSLLNDMDAATGRHLHAGK